MNQDAIPKRLTWRDPMSFAFTLFAFQHYQRLEKIRFHRDAPLVRRCAGRTRYSGWIPIRRACRCFRCPRSPTSILQWNWWTATNF